MFATSYDKIELNLLELFGSTKRDVDHVISASAAAAF